jgi:hypothetical protein
VAQRFQHLPLPLQFLQQVGFQVGTAGDFEDFEQGEQGCVVVQSMGLDGEEVHPGEQILQAQQSAYPFIERIVVANHAKANLPGSATAGTVEVKIRTILTENQVFDKHNLCCL